MVDYSLTWENPTNPTNLRCFENMERVEEQAGVMWLGGKNGATRNSSWGDRAGLSTATGNSATRQAGTWVQNLGKPRLIVVSVFHDNPGQLGGNESIAVLEVGTDGSTVDYEIGRSRKDTGSSLTRERHFPVIGIIQPNEYYRVRNASTGNADIDVDGTFNSHWYEYDFDAVHAAQAYSHGVSPGVTKLNTYANAVNDVVLADTLAAAVDSGIIGDVATLVNRDFRAGTGLGSGEGTIRQADEGGALTTIARLSTNQAVNNRRTYPLVVNPGGDFDLQTISGNVTGFNRYQWKFSLPLLVTFADGGSGTPTRDKYHDLDAHAARGFNVTKQMTRNEQVGAGPNTPSNDFWTFAVADINLDATGVAAADTRVDVDGNERGRASQGSGSNVSPEGTMMMVLVPPGSTYQFIPDAESSINRVTEWVVGS